MILLHISTFLLVSQFIIHWQGCERDVAEAANGGSDELKSDSIMRLSWALVHSRQPEDVQRGIAMLEGSYPSFLFQFFCVFLAQCCQQLYFYAAVTV